MYQQHLCCCTHMLLNDNDRNSEGIRHSLVLAGSHAWCNGDMIEVVGRGSNCVASAKGRQLWLGEEAARVSGQHQPHQQAARTAERHERSLEAQAIKRSCAALKPASELLVRLLDRRLAARSMRTEPAVDSIRALSLPPCPLPPPPALPLPPPRTSLSLAPAAAAAEVFECMQFRYSCAGDKTPFIEPCPHKGYASSIREKPSSVHQLYWMLYCDDRAGRTAKPSAPNTVAADAVTRA